MSIETVRITKQGRDQLSKLKSRTGIGQWNILCRWALCLSLGESSRPRPLSAGERPIEIAWKTFGGEYADLYLALVTQRCARDGLGTTEQVVADELHAHIHRGIAYLAGDPNVKTIEALITKATDLRPDERVSSSP